MRRIAMGLGMWAAASLTVVPSVQAADSGRTKNRSGIEIGLFTADPGGSTLGLNYAFHVTNFLRLSAGVGAYNAVVGQSVGLAPYNWVLRPILWFFSNIFVYAFTRQSLNYDTFLNITPVPGSPTVFHAGGLAKVTVPGLKLSPAVGVGYDHWMSGADYNGQGATGNQIYYTAGLDLQTDSGFNLSAHWAFFPIMSNQNGPALNFGFFF